MDTYNPLEAQPEQTSKCFIAWVVFSQVLGIISVILVAAWLGKYWDGFSWETPATTFNYHPLFMVVGLVFLYGDAILVYRVFRNYRKMPIKILHATLHILALIFAIIGLKAVFNMHERLNFPHLYSIHSWIGIAVVVLFCLQWLGGFLSFLIPQMPTSIRRKVLPFHVMFGNFLFVLVIAACISGITEKNIFSKVYSSLLPREQLGNVTALFIVLFGAVVFYILHYEPYRRVEVVSPEHRTLQ